MKDNELDLGHELLGDIKALAEEAAKVMGDETKRHSQEAIATLRAQFEVAESHFEEIYGEIKRNADQAIEQVDESVRKNPYRALAVVAGVAAVIGVLIGRSSRRR